MLLQVIVTTPMEMLKIQLQDAGRLGKRKFSPRGGLARNEIGCVNLEKQWPRAAMTDITFHLCSTFLFIVVSSKCLPIYLC